MPKVGNLFCEVKILRVQILRAKGAKDGISINDFRSMALGYDTFKKSAEDFDGDSCKAGLLIEKEDGTSDQHPYAKGREVLPQTVVEAIK